MRRPTLAQDEALLVAVLRALGHREGGHGSTRPWMRARLRARVEELGIADEAYARRLAADDAERQEAARRVACAMSRFFRGGRVLEALQHRVLPRLAARSGPVRAWSAGAARGEEAYTVAMLWLERVGPRPGAELDILASDIREDSLASGREGVFKHSSLRDVPAPSLAAWFEPHGPDFRVRAEVRRLVRFVLHDLERDPWPQELDLLLLRTVSFTYWGESLQQRAVVQARDAIRPGGWLALGRREALPPGAEAWFERELPEVNLFRRRV